MDELEGRVLVGVTGAGENTDALTFAISEARVLGEGMALVHAVHTLLPPPPPSVLIAADSWSEIGAAVMREARHELEVLLGDEPLPVSTLVRHGAPGTVLSDLSRQARVVVLQHRDLSRLQRIFTGSTVASVATHAHCLVVSVPVSSSDRTAAGVLTAGVHSDGGPRQVLEAAFAGAAARGLALRLVHAWRLAAEYDDIVATDPRWVPEVQAAIASASTELATKYPEVSLDIQVRHDWPADVLVRAAEDSERVVVGRHDGISALPPRLGSVARAVIAHASCPVMVVPT